jgi:predicted nucleic acid-binding protein
MAADALVVSTQVLTEFYATSTRRRLLAPGEALSLVSLWSQRDIVLQTPDLILRGIKLHQEHSLSIWDALIVQAAIDAHCDVLLTEDLQHGRRFGELQVVNPFAAPRAHEPAAAYRATMTPRKKTKGRRIRPAS